MRDFIVCGSGGFAREVFAWLLLSEKKHNIRFKGFLDKNNNLDSFGLSNYYLGSEENYNFNGESLLIAVANNFLRKAILERVINKNVVLDNFIHDSVIIGSDVRLGKGNILCPNTILTSNITIGDFNIINLNVTIGHDVKIGSFNTFSSHCDITGATSIENQNFMGSRVSILPKSKIGNNNKVSAGSVVYKGIKDNLIYKGNPAIKIGKNE